MGSPGVACGLDVQVPVEIPITVKGLSAHPVAALNLTFDNITTSH